MNYLKLQQRVLNSEDQALELGDLKTAIKLNWLFNAMKSLTITFDDATQSYMTILLSGTYNN